MSSQAMRTLNRQQPVPLYPLGRDEAAGSDSFTLVRSEGALVYESDLLIPHRKAY